MRRSPRCSCVSVVRSVPIGPRVMKPRSRFLWKKKSISSCRKAIPIFDQERQLVGVTLMLTDVTRLRHLDEVKTGLISTVSHELKTP